MWNPGFRLLNPFEHWGKKTFECHVCGWQGMQQPRAENICPECGSDLTRRSWMDTWGVTILILGVVVAVVMFVAYFGQ